MKVKLFGLLIDRVGAPELELPGLKKVADIRSAMEALYPGITDHCYMVAVNRAKADDSKIIYANDEVVLLPPFAGG